MHTEIRQKNGSKKYYLAHSFRAGTKVRKVSVYLGSNLTPQELEVKRSAAKSQLEDKIRAAQTISDPILPHCHPPNVKS
ncbi:hypothetical protein GX563_07590 [Candidatus Bathyarchaeota archaeon]|nr:hypothetical protein [Candidatus Bathyarchaeota archaeon]